MTCLCPACFKLIDVRSVAELPDVGLIACCDECFETLCYSRGIDKPDKRGSLRVLTEAEDKALQACFGEGKAKFRRERKILRSML